MSPSLMVRAVGDKRLRRLGPGGSIIVALTLAAAAALLSIPGRTGPDIQWLRASSVVPAIEAISGGIAEHPAEMIPP
jgi:hypothetical protein